MSESIYIGNFSKGLKVDRLPFAIDNDAFPTLYNFYSWRGRAKRKRGSIFLGILEIQVQSVLNATPPLSWQYGQITLSSGSANLITFSGAASGASIAPGSISVVVGSNTYTEPSTPDGTLIGSPSGSGTINYATGAIKITGGGSGPMIGYFSYYPHLPIMGLEDFSSSVTSSQYPLLIAFDTTYAYQYNSTDEFFYNVSFYKTTNNPVYWSGTDYQQFWSTNYPNTTSTFFGSFWVTNNKPGLHFVNGTYTSGSGSTSITFNLKSNGNNFTTLIVGDVLWFNEWSGGSTINQITGTVSDVSGASSGNYVVTFTSNQTVSGIGIAQLLTNSIPSRDGIRWYDGDPTSGTGLPTGTNLGWVNYMPPLTSIGVSIDNAVSDLYYLVGALAIVPFKDRLLFFSPWIQSSTSTAINLQDVVIWSWNGTPYYTVSDSSNTPSLVPLNQTANPKAYYVDQTGLGGYLAAGISQPIITVGNNQDALLVGFGGDGRKTRFIYTGNDLQPFLFFNINSELPSQSTFSSINLDRGMLDIGQYGLALTDQQSSQRVDLDIPDEIFTIRAQDNGAQRVNAIRDFYREWIYFSYPINTQAYDDDSICKFPLQTFLFNYRDNTWSILYENFTHHGNYRRTKKKTWATIGFSSWATWREPWNTGAGTQQFPSIVAGNPQGYVLIIGEGTGEGVSGTISAISNSYGNTQITSTNHCVSASNPTLGVGDYLYFQHAIGLLSATITAISQASRAVVTCTNTFTAGQYVTISGVDGMTELNGNSYYVQSVTGTSITIDVDSTSFSAYISGGTAEASFNQQIAKVTDTIDANNFIVDLPYPTGSSYLGLGEYSRLSQPLLQTKQFNEYWSQGMQTRLSVQKYLMDFTQDSQVTVNLYLSQDPHTIWNNPDTSSQDALISSQILYTCPESTNLGLTPANVNLQTPTAESQYQIWHRLNTSLIGESFQIGITLSDAQMRNLTYATSEITLHAMQLIIDQGPLLS